MNIEITDLDMILNYLETTSLKPHNDYTSVIFTYKDQKTLYKYIKQLQQENEMLHHYKLLYQKVKDRNDKAIEYIKKHSIDENGDIGINLFAYDVAELLNILKGDSNE